MSRIKSSNLKKRLGLVYALGAILVVVLVVVGIVIINGTQEDDGATSAKTEQVGENGGDDDSPPPLRTVAIDRGEGKNATAAAASPSIENPQEIWLRISSAPKQEVTGSWNVSCGSGNVTMDTFTVTPPHLMKLKLPGKTASCIAGSSAQLSASGRLKVAILRDR